MDLTRKQKRLLAAYMRRRKQVISNFILNLSAIGYLELQKERSIWVKKRTQKFWTENVSGHWTDEDWVANVRMNKPTFQLLLSELEQYIRKRDTNFRKAIPANIRLGVCLYFLCHSCD